jgi:hypothetical protein
MEFTPKSWEGVLAAGRELRKEENIPMPPNRTLLYHWKSTLAETRSKMGLVALPRFA